MVVPCYIKCLFSVPVVVYSTFGSHLGSTLCTSMPKIPSVLIHIVMLSAYFCHLNFYCRVFFSQLQSLINPAEFEENQVQVRFCFSMMLFCSCPSALSFRNFTFLFPGNLNVLTLRYWKKISGNQIREVHIHSYI